MLKRKINFDDESDDENDWDYNANDGKKVENNEDMDQQSEEEWSNGSDGGWDAET